MGDTEIVHRITDLIAREHQLRAARRAGAQGAEVELRELAAAEVELDQCWDLLRQRRARREFGGDPEQAQVRPPAVVERYLQ
jgi:hypothetical protein